MTPNEFVMWLDGYIAGGGSDVAVIAAKSKGVVRERENPYWVPANPKPQHPWRVDPDTAPRQRYVPSDGTNPWRMPAGAKPYRLGDGGTLCQIRDTQKWGVCS